MEKSICILRAIRSFRSCALLGSLTALLILSSTAVLAHDDDPHAANQSAPSADDSVDMDMPMDHDMSSMTESHGRSHDDQMDASHDANAMAGHDHHDHGSMVPGRRLVSVLILLTFAIAAGLIASIRRRARHGSAEVRASGKNLFDIPVLGTFLRSRQFLYWLIVPTLIVFTFIVAAGLFDIQTTQNPAVLLTWILWWPAVVFTFFLVGRIWCAICPFGYLGDVAQKIFSLRWKVPAFLRNMWWRIGLFVALTWATTVWALDRWPRGTAWLALAETLGAVLLAFIFEKRSFCRYLCPVGGVLGLY